METSDNLFNLCLAKIDMKSGGLILSRKCTPVALVPFTVRAKAYKIISALIIGIVVKSDKCMYNVC